VAGKAEYDHEVLYVDTWLGALVAELEKRRLLDHTLLIVVGDHGEALRDHGLTFCHGFYAYEELLHVPLLVRPPGGVARGERVPEMVGLADLAPTMLAAAGLPVPAELFGHDLLGARPRERLLLSEGGPVYPPPGQKDLLLVPGCRLTVAGNRGKCVAATTADFRLVMFPTADGADCALYDRKRDRAELHDVQAEHPRETETLRRALDAWRASWGPEREPGALDDETRRALGELGYR
jgi:arylsulfatase A-like enzyme